MFIKNLLKKRINLSEKEVETLTVYLEELWRWNKKINLVGVSSIKRVIDELLLDSLMAKEFIPENGTLLDIGSGAGFPAIPIKVVKPDIKTYLVEAKTKKAVFLRYVIRKMGLSDIYVLEGRMENIKEKLLPEYDIITFKGIRLSSALMLAYPYVRDGIIIGFHGINYKFSLNEVKEFMEEKGIRVFKIKEYQISKRKRVLLLFKRSRYSF